MSFITILIVLVSIFLILIVLVQNSKGGGLASNFSASNQVMGVRKTTDFLEKATWTSAAALLVLCFVAVMFIDKGEVGASEIDQKVNELQTQQEMQPLPSPAQVEQTEEQTSETETED